MKDADYTLIQKVDPDPDFQITVLMILRCSAGGTGMHSTESPPPPCVSEYNFQASCRSSRMLVGSCNISASVKFQHGLLLSASISGFFLSTQQLFSEAVVDCNVVPAVLMLQKSQ